MAIQYIITYESLLDNFIGPVALVFLLHFLFLYLNGRKEKLKISSSKSSLIAVSTISLSEDDEVSEDDVSTVLFVPEVEHDGLSGESSSVFRILQSCSAFDSDSRGDKDDKYDDAVELFDLIVFVIVGP
jgi:hypothetical protein